VKTTLEIPDTLFRRAKSVAARDGKSLKQYVNEAIEEKLKAGASRTRPEWLKLFGAIKGHRAELRRIDAVMVDEFERIDPEDWK
jgi:hypothetical protein